jgi:hypothetical protein
MLQSIRRLVVVLDADDEDEDDDGGERKTAKISIEIKDERVIRFLHVGDFGRVVDVRIL